MSSKTQVAFVSVLINYPRAEDNIPPSATYSKTKRLGNFIMVSTPQEQSQEKSWMLQQTCHVSLLNLACHVPAYDDNALLLQAKFPSPARIHLHRNAMLYIDHFDVQVQSLDLDGALVVEAQPGASVTIDGLQVHNRGWEWQPLKEGNSAAEHEKIRYANTAADIVLFMLGTPNPSCCPLPQKATTCNSCETLLRTLLIAYYVWLTLASLLVWQGLYGSSI